MEIQLIKFKARHIREMAPDLTDPAFLELAELAEESGGYTACLLGDPIAAAGIAVGPNGLGQAWAYFTPVMKQFPLRMARMVRRCMDEIIIEKNIHTVFSLVQPHDKVALAFMEHLGFTLAYAYMEKKVGK